MSKRVIQWPAEAIWEQISPILPNFTVEVLPEIDSTNTELMRRAKAGQIEPVLLIAEKQTAGRGRLGREWHDLGSKTSEEQSALTFSFGVPLSPLSWSGLSLVVGVSIAKSLHPSIGIKWPNDLWVSDATSDRKLAGILIETCSFDGARYAVIGVGINITQPVLLAQAPQPMLRRPATHLQEFLPTITAPQVLQRIMPSLVHDILQFATSGFSPFQQQFNALDVLNARKVFISNNIEGVGLGVNQMGEFLIQTERGQVAVNSSEVSVVPL